MIKNDYFLLLRPRDFEPLQHTQFRGIPRTPDFGEDLNPFLGNETLYSKPHRIISLRLSHSLHHFTPVSVSVSLSLCVSIKNIWCV